MSYQEQKNWIENLRKKGYKAAHPNDGWVDRDENIITFMYPQFFDNAKVGDYVMLGWYFDEGKLRSIKLIEEVNRGLSTVKKFRFEDDTRHEKIQKRNKAIDSLIDSPTEKVKKKFKFLKWLFG
jgi:hypothetical protein